MFAIPTITALCKALENPDASLRTLRGVAPVTDVCEKIFRTALFAEARVDIEGVPHLLCAPLQSDSLDRAGVSLRAVRHSGCTALSEVAILRGELLFRNSAGDECASDLLLQRLPAGMTLCEAVGCVETGALLSALGVLREEFLRCGIRHCNPKPSNFIYGGDGRLYPIRYYYMRDNASPEEITAEFDALEEYISSFPAIVSADECAAGSGEAEPGGCFDEIMPPRDMMRRIRCGALYGYADDRGEVMIPPQFGYAEDFYENRAVVAAPSGAGIIDRRGRFVVEPIYENVEFCRETGTAVAAVGGEWFAFDYMGRQLLRSRDRGEVEAAAALPGFEPVAKE